MGTAEQRAQLSFYQRFKKSRHRRVKRLGKSVMNFLSDFFGRQSLVGDRPLYDKALFPDVAAIEAHWRVIRAELDEVLRHRDVIPRFEEFSPDQMKITQHSNWKTFIFYGFGEKLERNCKQAPETTRLLEQIPNLQTAWFSILGPHSHVLPHKGVTKGVLRAHLGLIVPQQRKDCRMRVEDQFFEWEEGKIVVLDDTYEHEVWNDTDEERVVLLFDFDRPMGFWGRVVSKAFIELMRFTAYYQVPKKNAADFEDRFEAATRQAEQNTEKMSSLWDGDDSEAEEAAPSS